MKARLRRSQMAHCFRKAICFQAWRFLHCRGIVLFNWKLFIQTRMSCLLGHLQELVILWYRWNSLALIYNFIFLLECLMLDNYSNLFVSHVVLYVSLQLQKASHSNDILSKGFRCFVKQQYVLFLDFCSSDCT